MPPAQPKSIPEVLADLVDLVKTYAKQETVDPLKPLGTYLKFGVPGGLLVGLGGCFLALGLLRGLQRIEWFGGGPSFLPYVIVVVALGAWSALLVRKITARPDPVARPRVEAVDPEGSEA